MSPEATLLALLAAPLAGVLAIALLGSRPNARDAASVVTAGVLFALALSQVPPVMAGQRPSVRLLTVTPGLELAFEAEPLGMLFALVASGLWIATAFYSIGYMRAHRETHQTRFFACFALAIFSAMGAALAGNLFTLFLFYELMTLSTYPLVTHHGTLEAMRAGRVYLGVLLGTSIGFLLLAAVWTWSAAGTLDFRPGGILAGKLDPGLLPLLLALYAFGIGKAALMPFHRWLPAAMVAPAPVSALLHAVAVVKVGVFSVLKVAVYIFGLDLLASAGASTWLAWVAAFTIVTASVIALTKDNLKARLAYSTVSQLSYIVLGAALASSTAFLGGALHIAMHAFGKITLFFCAGAIDVAAHKTQISDMRGIGRRMPVTMTCFLLGALSVIGLPPFGGSWSKWFLALGAAERGEGVLVGVLMLSSLLSIAYLVPIVVRGFFYPGGEEEAGIREAPLFCLVPLAITALAGAALFFGADPLYRLLEPVVRP